MKITFTRTGGLGNIPVHIDLDSATMTQQTVSDFDKLLDKLLPFTNEPLTPSADVHTYDLLVERNGEEHHLIVNDLLLNDDMQELFDLIMQQQ